MANTRELSDRTRAARFFDVDLEDPRVRKPVEELAALLDEVRRETIEQCAKVAEACMHASWVQGIDGEAYEVGDHRYPQDAIRALAELRPVPDGAAPEGSGK